MAKVFLQDVVPGGKRSIRNIPLPGGKSESSRSSSAGAGATSGVKEKKAPPKKPTATSSTKTKGRFLSPSIIISIIVLVLVISYGVSYLLVSATVKIIPKEVNTTISVASTASIDSATSATGDLSYTIATLSKENSREVTANGQEKVEKKASGKIIIYNSFSSAPQTLIANTRFQTPAGLIFRIKDQVVVPGQKTAGAAGTSATPGSIAVTIYADKAGEQYNVGLADFTIPGFIGDAKFTKITAKSDPSSPISGGFIGTVMKVTPADAAAAKVSIETELKSDLQNDLKSQIPDTHVLFTGAYTFDFEELPQGEPTGNTTSGTAQSKAVIREKGSIYGILFDRNELAKFLASRTTDIGEADVHIANLDSLNFTLEKKDTFSPTATKEISFKIAGDAKYVWNINQEAIMESLVGKKRASIKLILANFESVDRANVSINPPWILSFPRDIDKISVEVEDPRNGSN